MQNMLNSCVFQLLHEDFHNKALWQSQRIALQDIRPNLLKHSKCVVLMGPGRLDQENVIEGVFNVVEVINLDLSLVFQS